MLVALRLQVYYRCRLPISLSDESLYGREVFFTKVRQHHLIGDAIAFCVHIASGVNGLINSGDKKSPQGEPTGMLYDNMLSTLIYA